MKNWDPDHPKAKLMARKRALILAAAKQSFLQTGFEGTSMDGIAKTAGVSIMTLYRHAENKSDLFSAVIGNACSLTDETERAKFDDLLRKPLADVLVTSGMHAQAGLTDPQTVALMRVVIAEAERFPDLAETAFERLIGRLEGIVALQLAKKEETAGLPEAVRADLANRFIDRLTGTTFLRLLCGLPGPTAAEQEQRARKASEELLATLAPTLTG